MLALALTLYEEGLCGGCGQPRDRAFNPDMEGYYSKVRRTCQACAAAEGHVEDEDPERRPQPGEKVAVVDTGWGEGFTPNPAMLRA